MYADDVQFLYSDFEGNVQELKTRVEANLAAAMTWYTQNRPKINPTKSEMIILKISS